MVTAVRSATELARRAVEGLARLAEPTDRAGSRVDRTGQVRERGDVAPVPGDGIITLSTDRENPMSVANTTAAAATRCAEPSSRTIPRTTPARASGSRP